MPRSAAAIVQLLDDGKKTPPFKGLDTTRGTRWVRGGMGAGLDHLIWEAKVVNLEGFVVYLAQQVWKLDYEDVMWSVPEM